MTLLWWLHAGNVGGKKHEFEMGISIGSCKAYIHRGMQMQILQYHSKNYEMWTLSEGRRMNRTSSRRAAYNMTLPVTLIDQLDATLGKKQSRSRVIEQLIRDYLPTTQVIHLYKCKCGHQITTPNRRQRFCRSGSCVGLEMIYSGEYTE